MEEMRRIAYETVLRACGFASLAIFCVMIGLSFLPRSAFQAGGFLSMVMTLVLVLKAREARTKDHRRTEMWLYLPKESSAAAGFRAEDDFDASCARPICRSRAGLRIISIVMWTIALHFLGHWTLVRERRPRFRGYHLWQDFHSRFTARPG